MVVSAKSLAFCKILAAEASSFVKVCARPATLRSGGIIMFGEPTSSHVHRLQPRGGTTGWGLWLVMWVIETLREAYDGRLKLKDCREWLMMRVIKAP